ncbi:DUF2642 domain-containing protein [Polycladomyces sp. WAk]|uniref:DUF2642 domain-containing protein n=2 Tax=Polycladomyces zharkentensis TaxID=2807616 RepID=A0ABS2WKT9_9BACL|nr:DUF2642 domain-containing protein [Polycladomyces sp. WAk]
MHSMIGRWITVETARGSVRGRLYSVLPDHIVVDSGGSPFLIRTQQIIWVVPTPDGKRRRAHQSSSRGNED